MELLLEPDVVDLRDVVVHQLGGGERLAGELDDEGRVVAQVRAEDLHRHVAIERDLPRQPHRAHAAAADAGQQLQPAQGHARRGLRRRLREARGRRPRRHHPGLLGGEAALRLGLPGGGGGALRGNGDVERGIDLVDLVGQRLRRAGFEALVGLLVADEGGHQRALHGGQVGHVAEVSGLGREGDAVTLARRASHGLEADHRLLVEQAHPRAEVRDGGGAVGGRAGARGGNRGRAQLDPEGAPAGAAVLLLRSDHRVEVVGRAAEGAGEGDHGGSAAACHSRPRRGEPPR